MALNFPGPYQLRFYYTTANSSHPALQHSQRFNIQLSVDVDPGDPFSAAGILTGSGGTIGADIIVDDYLALVSQIYSNAANNTWDFVELWKYTPGTFEAQFMSVYATNVPGASASAMNPANEQIMVFRTSQGGIMRAHYEESILSIGLPDTPPFANAALDDIREFIDTTPRPFLGADTSYPFATIALYPGQNEALFKRRFRNL